MLENILLKKQIKKKKKALLSPENLDLLVIWLTQLKKRFQKNSNENLSRISCLVVLNLNDTLHLQ